MRGINLSRIVAVGLAGLCLTTVRRCFQSGSGSFCGHSADPVMSCSTSVKKARSESLWGLFTGDSLSMPVHWYYDPDDIKQDYGQWLKGFVAPKSKHPSSILTISAVGGAGRNTFGDRPDTVIGSVILHDKLKFWQSRSRSVHYHQGMKAGDSTLNACVAGQTALTLSSLYNEEPTMDDSALSMVLAAYVKFMTTPGSHSDTYAESYHREFFRDWLEEGSPVEAEEVLKFADQRDKRLQSGHIDHNIDSIGALIMPIPVIMHCANMNSSDAVKYAVRLVSLTHCSRSLIPFVELYSNVLHNVLNGASLKDEAQRALESSVLGGSSTWKRAQKYSKTAAKYPMGSEGRLRVYQEAVSHFGLACYIKGAVTSLFFLAHEFHDNFEAGVLTNTNCGGENCHRGGALGALLGAEAGRTGKDVPKAFKSGLQSSQDVIQDILDGWK
ncbi:uncharacterized protein LOC117298367 isoform X1 [Asterias rubens]|uniref:uncharacterized protein LOC117298367 isoform X1 n=2 Tax=Asterias rubens TaxID=7604 RepID=UPI001455B7FE|nr:uncharacterized protein LOC117298367 isoform X1 [Asterias rubens]